nr:TonB-dependent receptor [Aquimarina sp. MMG016]
METNTRFKYTFINDKNIAIRFVDDIQQICGKLFSLESNKIISDALINTETVSTISDTQGGFKLEVNDPDEIINITCLGYKSIKIKVKDFTSSECKEIRLIPEVQYLKEVVIRDYLTKGISKNSDGSVTIDYTDFGILPGLIEPDLLQTIQALPGILSVDETVSNINVRGGTNDQNLILWDGIKMYQSSHFFGLISAFNPYLTKNIRITKNGSSAKYGDGVSSVIAMSTENNINQKFDASIGLNMLSVDGYIDTPIGEKTSLQLAVRKSISEIAETPTYDQYKDKAFQESEVVTGTDEEFSFFDTSARLLYQITPKDLIKVNALITGNNLVFQENTKINQIDVSRESSAKQNNFAGGILYQRNWSNDFQSELLFYGTNYRLEAINADIINNQRLLQENEVLESGIKLNTLLKLGSSFNINTGYQFNETGISDLRDLNNPTFRDRTKEVVRTNSLFSEMQYRSKNYNTYLTFGLRLNHYDKFNSYLLEPRLSFNHKLNNRFTIEMLGEFKSQVTSQIIESQNDFLGLENRKWILSNEIDIPIVKSKQASVGINYNHNNWLISTEIYYKDIEGIIARSQGFQDDFEGKKDQGEYNVVGADFLLNRQFKNFSVWLSYSYAENNYRFNALSEKEFPNNLDIRHNINIALAYTLENFKFSSGLNWHSGKPITRPIPGNETEGNDINYQDPNSDTIKDYLRLDTSATYNFRITKKIKALAGVSIWNIFNQENTVNNFYRINSSSENVEEVKEFGLKFTPNVVFRVNF